MSADIEKMTFQSILYWMPSLLFVDTLWWVIIQETQIHMLCAHYYKQIHMLLFHVDLFSIFHSQLFLAPVQ